MEELIKRNIKQVDNFGVLKPLRNLENISEEEVKQISIEKASEGLNDEYFFDGQYWRNYEGKLFTDHPNLPVL